VPAGAAASVEAEREEEVAAEDATNERLIKAIARMGAKAKMDIPVYEGNIGCRGATRLD
jgi:hypothetical protein